MRDSYFNDGISTMEFQRWIERRADQPDLISGAALEIVSRHANSSHYNEASL